MALRIPEKFAKFVPGLKERLEGTCIFKISDGITWDNEDAYNYVTVYQMEASDYMWVYCDLVIDELCTKFKETLCMHIEEELHATYPNEYKDILKILESGGDITNPVEIALDWQPYYEDERLHIADGWHRTALYLKAGRTTIPAFVGVPKQSSSKEKLWNGIAQKN